MEQFEGSEGISQPQGLGEQGRPEEAAREQGGEEVESREGGDELGGAEVVSDRTGLEAPGGGTGQHGADEELEDHDEPDSSPRHLLGGRGVRGSRPRTRRRVRGSDAAGRRQLTASQRLLILDTWMRSKLPATDFASLAGVSPHTLYGWRKRFEEEGPAGLADPQGRRGGQPAARADAARDPDAEGEPPRLGPGPDPRRADAHRGLRREPRRDRSRAGRGGLRGRGGRRGRTRPRSTRFERTRPNELWQTDLFTFVLKRENRRVHLVAFLDDYSRFIVGFGLYASASGALVREVFEAAIANFGAPEEVLTDNGTQYHTWRGKSAFTKLCERRGIRQIVAAPRRPQTLGKIERFWGTLWRECVRGRDLPGARRRARAHRALPRSLQLPAPAPGARRAWCRPTATSRRRREVRQTLAARVQANALELAQHGEPRKPFYLTGRVGGKSISLHAEGERVILTDGEGQREEVDLSAPGRREHEPGSATKAPLTPQAAPPDHPVLREGEDDLPPPASSPLDGILKRLERGLDERARTTTTRTARCWRWEVCRERAGVRQRCRP